MCGRFTLATEDQQLIDEFELTEPVALTRRYNIAPTQPAAVVRSGDDGRRTLSLLRWGFIPHWAKDAQFGLRTINARSETVHESPVFRSALRRRRCLVPCSGFYEWKAPPEGEKKGKKQPYYIRRRDERVLALAGLWDCWKPVDGGQIASFTVLTTTPNDVLRPLHDRMPVIIDRADYDRWLSPAVEDEKQLRPLLRPFEGDLVAYPVSTLVNRPGHDDPACIIPLSGSA